MDICSDVCVVHTQTHNHLKWIFVTMYYMSHQSIYYRNMTPTVKHLFGNYQMDIYNDACMCHTLSHNHLNWQFLFTIYYYM